MNLSKTAILRPVTTMMVFLSLVVIGGISTRLLPLEYFPEVTFPAVWVNLPYPGSTPEEVEEQITRPVEEALATLSGVQRMTSFSREDGGNVTLFFDWGSDNNLAAMQIREKLDGVRDQLPDDMERFFVFRGSTADMPILELRISSHRDLSGAYELLDRKLKRPIERIDGVSQVELNGVTPKEVRIELLAGRIAAHNLDLGALVQTLQRSNFSVSAGQVDDGGRRYILRPVGMLQSIDEIRNLPVGGPGLRLSDVADVVYDDPRPTFGRHLDGDFAVSIEIKKEAQANTVAVTREILDEINALANDPEMKGIAIYEMDNAAAGITSSINELLKSGMMGAVFAFIVLFFFLRRVATTLIVALAVPVSLLITLGVIYFMGLSLNILSMMGLMLAIGMLVDNAVVVTESIHRHQQLHPGNRLKASLEGVREVGLAVTAGTLTTAIVFLPFIVSPADQVTLFMKHVSITICVALVASLLIAQTIVPLLTARLKLPEHPPPTTLIDRAVARYGRMLDWLLRHRWAAAGLIVGTLASTAIPINFVSFEFDEDGAGERRVRLYYHINGTYTLDRVEAAVNDIEAYLFANKEALEIESVYSWYTTNEAQSTLLLRGEDHQLTVDEIQERVAEGLPKLAIGTPNFTWRSAENDQSMRFVLHGESSAQLGVLAADLARTLNRMPGFKDALSEAEAGEEEVHVVVDRNRASHYGFSTQEVATTVASAMRGQNLRRFQTPNGEVAMRLEFQGSDRTSPEDLEDLILRTGDQSVRLAAMADLRQRRGPWGIYREDRITSIGVQASLDGLEPEEARERLAQMLDSYAFPTGYGWSFGASFRDDEASQQILLINLLIALVLIYLVMAALFESLIHPLAIWSSILFALVGVFWFFLITGTTFSIMAWIGLFILVGIVVNNGIVLIDHINLLRREGLSRHDAIVQGGRDRLRPIVMTAATTVLGLIPLCITNTQIGGDGPPYYPMARAIVGGLTFSTVVTLVILPAVYVMLDDLRLWGHALVRQADAEPATPR